MRSMATLLFISILFCEAGLAQSTKLRVGKHLLTLQWIGAEKPGSVFIVDKGKGIYTVKGEQKNVSGDFLSIEGTLQIVNSKELRFEGKITSNVSHINGGKPCLREGVQTFKATGTRKYWRLQKMTNCEGGMVVDYIDIYF